MVVETTIALVLIFGVLVMAHELGHFGVAKLLGIRVEEFAFGWGPKLATLFKRHGTKYTLHLLPMGGFVKLAGMEPDLQDIPDGFQAQPVWKRSLVILAGPLMSFVLAVAAFLFVGVYWGFPDLNLPESRVGQVSPQTEAARINLRAGDRILEINGIRIRHGKDLTEYIHSRPGVPLKLVVQRDGHALTRVGTPQYVVMYLGASWSFMRRERGLVEGVAEHTAAKRAGVMPDDTLLAINGRKILGGKDMVEAIKSNGSREVSLELMRAGKRVSVTAKPDIEWVRFAGVKWGFPGAVAESGDGEIQPSSTAGRAGVRIGDEIVSVNGIKNIGTAERMLYVLHAKSAEKKASAILLTREGLDKPIALRPMPADFASLQTGCYDAVGLLGFMPAPTLVPAGFAESIKRGLSQTGLRVAYLLKTITSKQIAKDVGGPVMIAKATAQSVALGPYYVIEMAGMLSLSLSVINLIPIPILDGGLLLIFLLEAIRRKRLSQQQMQAVMLAGFMMIAVLTVLVVYMDIFRISRGLVPQ